MMAEFDGKVTLVTGGAAGIGRAAAFAFAEQGAYVVLSDVRAEDGEKTAADIRRSGAEATFVQADMSVPGEVAAMVAFTVKKYGRLDLAFNNAGVESKVADIVTCPESEWDRVIGINLKGVWLCLKHEIEQMLQQDGGIIVNTASIAGLIGIPNFAPYIAAKHAVIGLTKAAALEYSAQGIRVNAVCPGWTDTGMVDRLNAEIPEAVDTLVNTIPMGRKADPEEIARTVLWLCSEAASYVTGQAVAVDGGYTVR